MRRWTISHSNEHISETRFLRRRSSIAASLLKNTNANMHPKLDATSTSEFDRSVIASLPTVNNNEGSIMSATESNFAMEWSDLSDLQQLAMGGFSLIYSGVFNGKAVVVKKLKPEFEGHSFLKAALEKELETHMALNHENVVELVGAGLTPRGDRFLVFERLNGGTLTEIFGLKKKKKPFWKQKELSLLDALRHARSLADAIQYCHDKAIPGYMIIHRDLKPDNIAFTEDGRLKLIDFGFAAIVKRSPPSSETKFRISGNVGTPRYMAPEVAKSQPYNHKADIYSFGLILWAMLTCRKPFSGKNTRFIYANVWNGKKRPTLDIRWPKSLCKLLKDCWSQNISDRPGFNEIFLLLDNMISIMEERKNRTCNKKT